MDIRYPVISDYPTTERWFHGFMSAVEAEKCLMTKGENGSYLVRASESKLDELTLSARNGDKVFHIKIGYKDKKYHAGSNENFDTLEELVDFYKENSIQVLPESNELTQQDGPQQIREKCIKQTGSTFTDMKSLKAGDKCKEKYQTTRLFFHEVFTRATSTGDKQKLLKLLNDCYKLELRLFLEDNPNAFIEVCKAGFFDVAEILLNEGANINSEYNGMTPLQQAASRGDVRLVKYLLCRDAEVSRDVWKESSPFYLASYYGHFDVVVALTSRFPSCVKDPVSRGNLLFAACKGGNLDIVKFWYLPQMDLNLPIKRISTLETCENMTPLYAACEGKHVDVAKFLVDIGVTLSVTVCAHFPEITGKLVEDCFRKENKGTMYVAEMSGIQLKLVRAMWFEQYGPKLTRLDLSDNKLKALPSVIPWGLPCLLHLNLSNNRLQEFDSPEEVILCRNIKKIDLSINKLKGVCADLFCLPSLISIDLSTNKIDYLVRPFHDSQTKVDQHGKYGRRKTSLDTMTCSWNLPCLTTLNVSNNTLVSIPEEIRTCYALTHLDARDNNLNAFIAPWKCPLQILDLSYNYLDCFPDGVEEFWSGSLEILYLQTNRLQHISDSIVKLSELKTLDLSNNEIDRLPQPRVWDCRYLETLNLASNNLGEPQIDEEINREIQSSPKTTKNLSVKFNRRRDVAKNVDFPKMLSLCLQHLNLRNNNLDQVPPGVCKLQSLSLLDISQNPLIKTLPRELGLLIRCRQLVLTDNVIIDDGIPGYLLSPLVCDGSSPPPSAATKDLLEHLRRLQRKCVSNNRLKMIIIGQQERGKSTLLSLLQGKSGVTPNHDNKIHTTEWRLREQKLIPSNKMDILFNAWELPGHPDLSIIHQCFLTQNALYLLVFDLRKDYHHLHDWLCQIQATAHKDSVILVGTFYDKLDPRMEELKLQKVLNIKQKYPIIKGFQFVSCATKAGISDLKKTIYRAAIGMTDVHNRKEPFVGMKFPQSYRLLMEYISKVRTKLEKNEQPPIMTEEMFSDLLKDVQNNEIAALGDVSNALQYLVEVGCLLHFNEQLQSLNTLYFLDPVYLQEILALIAIFSNKVVSRATVSMNHIEERFKRDRLPYHLLPQFIQILKMFEIAVETANGTKLLVPSKLPKEQPMICSDINENIQSRKISRLYKLMYIPPGLWSCFIIRLLKATDRFSQTPWFLNAEQASRRMSTGLEKRFSCHGLTIKDRDIVYWREGIRVAHGSGYFLVESVSYEIPDSEDLGIGILVTIVSPTHHGLSAMAVIVDELDDILRDYFPGFQDFVDEFPSAYSVCPSCYEAIKDESGIVVHIDHFDVQTCALAVLSKGEVTCPKGKKIRLEDLVPEMLFKELPKRFFLDNSLMTVSETPLGSGAAGAVFPGKYGESDVVIKVFHKIKSTAVAQDSVDSGRASLVTQGSQENSTHGDTSLELTVVDEAKSFKAYKAFSEVRKEVAVLSKLRHPCIVSFLGLSVRPDLYIAMELARHGSLRGVLEKEMANRTFNKFTDKNMTFSSVFNKDITFKIIYQVGKGLEYLHEHSIIYRDLKSDNVLVCSLDVNDTINVKLSDYGISKFSTSQGLSGFVGTLGYIAPEILNKHTYTEKVDIFSFSMLMYEILSGHRPYDDCLNLSQAVVKEKRRPDIKYLMSVCWDHDASKRPSAADITKYMRHHQFVCQYDVVSLPEPGAVFSDVTCIAVVSENGPDNSRNHQLWIWDSVNENCDLFIYDYETNTFLLPRISIPGARVYCMLKVDEYILVGTNSAEIEIFGLNTAKRMQREDKLSLTADPTVILFYKKIGSEQGTAGHVFIGLTSGAVAIFSYQPNMRQKLQPVKTLTLSIDRMISAMTLVSEGRELWMACGHTILIVSMATLLKEGSIDVMEESIADELGENPQIQQLVCNGDMVWCSFTTLSKILEYDAEVRQAIYSLDICNDGLKCQLLASDLVSGNGTDETDDTDVAVLRRPKTLNASLQTLNHDSYDSTGVYTVSSILVVHDTLWIGTSRGTIKVVGINGHHPDSPRPMLTEMESVSRGQGQVGPVYMLTAADSLVVSGIQIKTGSCVETDLAAWQAIGSDRFSAIGNFWQNLRLEEGERG